jgi:hypothetical protein
MLITVPVLYVGQQRYHGGYRDTLSFSWKVKKLLLWYEEGNALEITVCNEGQHNSVADPDPGSGAF